MRGFRFYILALLFLILIAGNVNAQLGNFPANSSVTIVAPLNATSVTLTNVNYPNGSLALVNRAMTSTGSLFTYAFNSTSSLGTYTYGFCDNLGNCYSNDFVITQTGNTLSSAQGTIYLVFALVIILVFIGTLTLAIKIKWNHTKDEGGKLTINKLRYLKLFFIPMCYIELIWFFGIMYNLTHNYLNNDVVSSMFYWLYDIMLKLLIPLVVITLIISLIVFFQDKALRKKIFRGYNPV